MTQRAFTDIAGRVEAQAPKVPRPLVIEHIRRAARKTCEKTLSWRYQIPVYNLVPGVHEYAFGVPDGSEVEHVFGTLVNNAPLKVLTLDDAICAYPAWADLYSGEDASVVWSETPGGYVGAGVYDSTVFNPGSDFVLPAAIVAAASFPQAIVSLSPQRYIILPLPDGATTYRTRMFVALKPTVTATSMEEQAFNEIEDGIIERALETLFTMPGKEWTDGPTGVYHAEQFRKFYLEKRARANIGLARAPMRVRTMPWA